MLIGIEIDSCRGCPHHLSTPYPTADSWERAEYWWCQKIDEIHLYSVSIEKTRQSLKSTGYVNLRYVAEYVEWNDKTPIPEWCPCKVESLID